MKTYPYSKGKTVPDRFHFTTKKLILLILFICLAMLSFAQSGSGGGRLTFKNSFLETGTSGTDGAVYRFPQVTNDIDALVKIKSRSSSLVYLVDIDMVTSGFDKAWQPQVGYNYGSAPGPADWWMEFEMSFVKKGTTTPAPVDEFNLSAIDIDGNGHLIREYMSFYGLTSYTLEANSLLGITDLLGVVGGLDRLIGKRFDGPTVNFTNIDTSGTAVMTTAKYLATQTFSVRTGGVSTGASGASERMYSLYFQTFKYNQPQEATLPVKLKSFDAKLVSNTAVLDWVSESELNFSHYIVEKSVDGKNFRDLTMVFAAEETGKAPHYSYTESLEKSAVGLLYYRLKMVDEDGFFKYSAVRILKLHSNATVSVTAYPNPVVSELRITVPSEWQDRKVIYDMFNSTGKMVKRVVSTSASQTETINMNDVNAGTYVIRLSSEMGSAVQQIVKSR